jgi:predicted DNA-binding transcriptional regulator AlpA
MNSPYGPARRPQRPVAVPVEEIVLWDTDDVCRFLKIPKDTLFRWNAQGTGPNYTKIGKYARYKKSDVIAWFEAQPKSTD